MPTSDQSQTAGLANSAKQTIDNELDITGYLCPMTFVRTRLAIDRMKAGQTLAIRLTGEEPRTNIPKSVIEHGHQVLAATDHADGTTTLLIRKS